MRLLSFIFSLFMVGTVAMGADRIAPPADPASRAAVLKYTQAVQQADEAARKAKLAAAKTFITALTKAKDAAMKSGNLEAANEAQALIDTAQAEVDALTPGEATPAKADKLPAGKFYTIEAAKEWQDTVEVKQGDKVTIKAGGEWTYRKETPPFGPSGYTIDNSRSPHYYLEGRIGDGSPFAINDGLTLNIGLDGMLQMEMKNMRNAGPREDNTGEMKVTVQVQPAPER